MKKLKKINKGLILTLVVLLAIIIYVVVVEKQREADKICIKQVCEDFINLTDKYSRLPEQMQNPGETIEESQVEEYKKQMKDDLKELMIDNEDAVKIQYQILEDVLSESYSELDVTINQKRKINRISEYEFDGNKVTVNCINNLERKIKYFDGTEEKLETKSFEALYDEIILQKEHGIWKVVYSNLQFNEYEKPYMNIER